uniref:Nuclease HARBI1 n=1 Tax=Romanomermis culicivorax TaxID=13658 RepID=A0A915IR33_ROMCU
MRLVGDTHGVSKATMSRVVHRIVESINLMLFDEVIKWPDDIANVNLRFFHRGGLPSVVGCLDGTHIPIKAPTANEDPFVNCHGDHSLNCMIVA